MMTAAPGPQMLESAIIDNEVALPEIGEEPES